MEVLFKFHVFGTLYFPITKHTMKSFIFDTHFYRALEASCECLFQIVEIREDADCNVSLEN